MTQNTNTKPKTRYDNKKNTIRKEMQFPFEPYGRSYAGHKKKKECNKENIILATRGGKHLTNETQLTNDSNIGTSENSVLKHYSDNEFLNVQTVT